jgi:hypothetical protein
MRASAAMVDVAQLVEPRIVDPAVVGSSPIVHPNHVGGDNGIGAMPRARTTATGGSVQSRGRHIQTEHELVK